MITFRQQLKQLLDEGCASYLLWDASPQGGSDYEMFIWEFISNKHLFEVQVNVEDLESRHFLLFSHKPQREHVHEFKRRDWDIEARLEDWEAGQGG